MFVCFCFCSCFCLFLLLFVLLFCLFFFFAFGYMSSDTFKKNDLQTNVFETQREPNRYYHFGSELVSEYIIYAPKRFRIGASPSNLV